MLNWKMTSGELLNEYESDLPEIQELTVRYFNSNYVTDYLKKRRKKSKVIINKVCTTSSGNRYLGILVCVQNGAGKNKRWMLDICFHAGLMKSHRGTCVIIFYQNSRQTIRILPHFFHRYKERFTKVCDWKMSSALIAAQSIEDIAALYFRRNLGITWIETPVEYNGQAHIFAPVSDGVMLLQWSRDKKVLQANTFITFNMLNKEQKEMVGYAKIYQSMPLSQRMQYGSPDFINESMN